MVRKAVQLALMLGDSMKTQDFPLLRDTVGPKSKEAEEGLDQFIRRRARISYHFSRTSRMASEFDYPAPGVVDDSFCVYRISNLRVCDASVCPQIITSHLQARVVVVAEKCASMTKANGSKK